jgi:ABC-type transporter Mla subunit MlaD
MKTLLTIALTLLLPLQSVFAATAEATEPSELDEPLVNIKMMLDLKGIEQSIDRSAVAIDNLATSLTLLSKNESLNEEQRQVLVDTMDNINELTEMSKQSLIALPGALEQSQNSIANSTKKFAYDVRFNVLLLLALLVFAIVLALIAAYWLILRPMQGTIIHATRNVSKMASAIHQTAESLETTTANQKVLTERLAAHEVQSTDQTSRN